MFSFEFEHVQIQPDDTKSTSWFLKHEYFFHKPYKHTTMEASQRFQNQNLEEQNECKQTNQAIKTSQKHGIKKLIRVKQRPSNIFYGIIQPVFVFQIFQEQLIAYDWATGFFSQCFFDCPFPSKHGAEQMFQNAAILHIITKLKTLP